MEEKAYNHGYLPHVDIPGQATFVTFRQGDSLPASVIKKYKEETAHLPELPRRSALWKKMDAYMDSGKGSCLLALPEHAEVVQGALQYGRDEGWYDLLAWVVMPNHVHFVARLSGEKTLGSVLQSIKRFSSRNIGPEGTLWQRDYFDRLIRKDDHLAKTIAYIENNPVKARLVESPEDFRFSSAYGSNSR